MQYFWNATASGLVRGTALVALAAWLILTVLIQLPWFRGRFGRFNVLGFLPNWGMFTSPLLGMDLIPCVRLQGRKDWQALSFVRDFGPWTVVWNPRHRLAKAILDTASWITRLRSDPIRIRSHRSYVALLALAAQRMPESNVAEIRLGLRMDEMLRPHVEILELPPPLDP